MPLLISSFAINGSFSIDSGRMVVTNSTYRDSIQYKYDGMQVFTTDSRTLWSYNLSNNSWIDFNSKYGIYSGSGNLIGNTYVDIGTVSNIVGSQSYNLVLKASASNIVDLTTYFTKHTAGSNWYNYGLMRKFYNESDSNNVYMNFGASNSLNVANIIDFGVNTNRVFTILSGMTDSTGTASHGIKLYSPTYSANISPIKLNNSQIIYFPNNSGTLVLNEDLTLQNATITGNTTSSILTFLNNNYSTILSATAISLYAGTSFSVSLSNDSILRIGNLNNTYKASILTATLSNNFTYSLPDSGGIFDVNKRRYVYSTFGISGSFDGLTYSLYSNNYVNTKDFIVTSIIQNNVTPNYVNANYRAPLIIIGTERVIPGLSYSLQNNSIYSPNDSVDKFKRYGYSRIWNNNINWPDTPQRGPAIISPGYNILLTINTPATYSATYSYVFDIHVEGFYA